MDPAVLKMMLQGGASPGLSPGAAPPTGPLAGLGPDDFAKLKQAMGLGDPQSAPPVAGTPLQAGAAPIPTPTIAAGGSPAGPPPGIETSPMSQPGVLTATGHPTPQLASINGRPTSQADPTGMLGADTNYPMAVPQSGQALNNGRMPADPSFMGAIMGTLGGSSGGPPVGSQAYAINELARQLAMGAGGGYDMTSNNPAEIAAGRARMANAQQMAMGQMSQWSDQAQKAKAQSDLAAFQTGSIGVQQGQLGVGVREQQLKEAQAQLQSSPESQEKADRMLWEQQGQTQTAINERVRQKKLNGGYTPALQLPPWSTAPGSASSLPANLASPIKPPMPPAEPTSGIEPPSFAGQIEGMISDPKGNPLPPEQVHIDQILGQIENVAPKGYLNDPKNVQNVMQWVASKLPGGMDQLKSHVAPGAFTHTGGMLESTWRGLTGQPAISSEQGRRAAFANAMGWPTAGSRGPSLMERAVPVTGSSDNLQSLLRSVGIMQ